MEIIKTLNENELTLTLKGELNSANYKGLEDIISTSLKGITKLVFDFKELTYISSAGLRILLISKKIMNSQGEMIVLNVNEQIMEIFEITGFKDILNL